MFPYDFFSNPVNAELAMLLVASPINDDEKRAWFTTLPLMTDDQKERLKRNLQEEVKDFAEIEKKTIDELDKKIQELFSKK